MSRHHNPFSHEPAEIAMAMPQYYHHRRRYGSRERFRRGRLWLLLLFCVLRGSDALIYFGSPASDRPHLLAAILVGAIWTAAAMAGVWSRQNWCRGALGLLIVLSTVSYTLFLPVYQLPANYRVLAFLAGTAALNGAVIWAVTSLHDVKRLTSRAYL
jgi:hypothetical protein